MSNNNMSLNTIERKPDWVTVREAIRITNRIMKSEEITDSDIYRHALYGDLCLSIYFQSSIILRKINTSDHKVKLRPIRNSLTHRLSLLERNCFLSGRCLILSTGGRYIYPTQKVIDTQLTGHEYVLVQRLLARALGIPLPIIGSNDVNYGITVTLAGQLFQVFENITWQKRIKRQLKKLPKNIAMDINKNILSQYKGSRQHKGYFPIHNLPTDACFVIRYKELEKLINMPIKKNTLTDFNTNIHPVIPFVLACLST